MSNSRSFELDDAVFQSKIRKLAKKFNIEEESFVAEQGAIFINDLGRFVPPYAEFPTGNSSKMGTPADNKAGKLAIQYDLEKIFTVPKNSYVFDWAVKTFKGWEIKKGTKVIGAGTLMSLAAMKKFHNDNRKPSNGRTRSLRDFQKMWVDKAMFNKYLKMEQMDVGIAKASVAKAVLKLNPKVRSKARSSIPAWIMKQMPKASGDARMSKLREGWTATFEARAFGLQHLKGKTINIVKKNRLIAMEKRLKYIFKNAAKDSGWFVR
jgi:hypothetical protein|tara:strand:+ start:155 stop:949 length:795 start_codon:yes stop_codon:yes gene_type:complete